MLQVLSYLFPPKITLRTNQLPSIGPLHAPHPPKPNEVLDRYNSPISFYPDVGEILHRLHQSSEKTGKKSEKGKVVVAACSRTDAPKLARQCLNLLLVPHPSEDACTPAVKFFHHMEIYPGSKIAHFKSLHSKTFIPYEEMLFFDDERRNAEVEKLGITFHHTPHGLSHHSFEAGLKAWRERNPPSTASKDDIIEEQEGGQ